MRAARTTPVSAERNPQQLLQSNLAANKPNHDFLNDRVLCLSHQAGEILSVQLSPRGAQHGAPGSGAVEHYCMDLPFHDRGHPLKVGRGGDEFIIRSGDRRICHESMNAGHQGSGLGQDVESTRSFLWEVNVVRAVKQPFDETIELLLADES